MKKERIKLLEELLDEYFKIEFEFYRKQYELIYPNHALDESLFSFLICEGAASGKLFKELEKAIMDQIEYVFILKKERPFYEDKE